MEELDYMEISENVEENFDFLGVNDGIDDITDLSVYDEIRREKTRVKKEKFKLNFFLKAAKSRENQYKTGDFPSQMLCAPYKYHLKIVGRLPNHRLSLHIVFAENVKSKPKTTKQAVIYEEMGNNSGERVVKFSFHICSFHYKRKEFKLRVLNGTDEVYLSSAFRTYARRRVQSSGNSNSSMSKNVKRSNIVGQKRGTVKKGGNIPYYYPQFNSYQYTQQNYVHNQNVKGKMLPKKMMNRNCGMYNGNNVRIQQMYLQQKQIQIQKQQQQQKQKQQQQLQLQQQQQLQQQLQQQQQQQMFNLNGLSYGDIAQLRQQLAVQLLNSMSPLEKRAVLTSAGFTS